MSVHSILIVCEGNICRSPMAEALAIDLFPRLHISSAGLNALVGKKADPFARSVVTERGLCLDTHVARQLGWSMVKGADMILVMSAEQKKRVEDTYRFATGRTYRVGHFQKFDVADPYQKSKAEFEEAFASIEAGLKRWSYVLEELNV
ncbi:low molecular weight protein-tyrosine-phosphatase [Paraburkholderia aromaticivorans]|uniref:low molecular weight protein-tyrosine-phosphatase n=1 Tax=Paraburkholderia aromaticivorans TaxID=2026199 RepID=UPI0038B88EF4